MAAKLKHRETKPRASCVGEARSWRGNGWKHNALLQLSKLSFTNFVTIYRQETSASTVGQDRKGSKWKIPIQHHLDTTRFFLTVASRKKIEPNMQVRADWPEKNRTWKYTKAYICNFRYMFHHYPWNHTFLKSILTVLVFYIDHISPTCAFHLADSFFIACNVLRAVRRIPVPY